MITTILAHKMSQGVLVENHKIIRVFLLLLIYQMKEEQFKIYLRLFSKTLTDFKTKQVLN